MGTSGAGAVLILALPLAALASEPAGASPVIDRARFAASDCPPVTPWRVPASVVVERPEALDRTSSVDGDFTACVLVVGPVAVGWTQPFDPQSGEGARTLPYVVRPLGTLVIRVLSRSGRPLSGVQVRVVEDAFRPRELRPRPHFFEHWRFAPSITRRTDFAGFATFDHLPVGDVGFDIGEGLDPIHSGCGNCGWIPNPNRQLYVSRRSSIPASGRRSLVVRL